jgi:hypothetical protein
MLELLIPVRAGISGDLLAVDALLWRVDIGLGERDA